MKKGLISVLSLGILVLSFASGYLINDVAKRQKTKYPDSFLRLYEVYNIIQNVSFDDIKYIAYPVLRHRIILNFEGITEGITEEYIIEKILEDLRVV